MRSSSMFARRWANLASPTGLVFACAYAGVCIALALDPQTMHDEGLLVYSFARSLTAAFFPWFFFQKIKPALALFYAPFARLGIGPYMVAHAIVAAATLYWTSAVARSLKYKRSWIPALVVALSPLYTWSAITGVSNSDGVAVTALFLYLLEVRKNYGAAGLVLGLLPWVRYEQALFSAVMAIWVLYRHRQPAFLIGLVSWPLVYLGGGAIYHHDPLWFLHFLPNVSNLDSGNVEWIEEFARHNERTAFASLVMVSPAVFALPLLRVQRLRSLERVFAFFTVGFFIAFVVTHLSPRDIGPAFTLGFSSRYAVVPLVPLALLFGRVIEQFDPAAAPRMWDTMVAGAWLVVGWFVRTTILVPLYISMALGGFVAAMRANLQKTGLAVLFALLVWLPLSGDQQEMRQSYPLADPHVAMLAKWLEEHEPPGDVYTNHQLLVPFMMRQDHRLTARTKFMLASDHQFELVHLSNPNNGQTTALLDSTRRTVFAYVVPPDELDPHRLPLGTWFVLIDDARTKQILPPDRWQTRLKLIAELSWGRVYELVP